MPLREILTQTIAALWDNKLRSVLTMFGIVWGITSVILLVGLGIGFNIQQKEQLRTIGTDIAILFGGKTGMPSGGYAAGRDVRLTIDDVRAITQRSQPGQKRLPRAPPHRLRGQPLERLRPRRPRRLARVSELPLAQGRAGPPLHPAG